MLDESSPIPITVEKYLEMHYFLHGMLHLYHFPADFVFTFSAFVQALHNTRAILFKEVGNSERDKIWKAGTKEKLNNDVLLRKFWDARNLVVHQGVLRKSSKAFIGLYRRGKAKLAMEFEISPFSDNQVLFERAPSLIKELTGESIESHHENGCELGINREWIFPEIGDEEIVGLSSKAFIRFSELLIDLHENLYDQKFPDMRFKPDMEKIRLKTEF